MRLSSQLLLFTLALGIAATLGVLSAPAQVVNGGLRPPVGGGTDRPRQGRYVPFDIPADAEARFQEQFKDAEQLQQFREMLDKILRDPNFKVDPELFKGLNLKDPELQKKLHGWVDRNGTGKQLAPEEVNKLKELLKPPPVEAVNPPELPPQPPTPRDRQPQRQPAQDDNEAPFRDWLKNVMERAQESRLGDALRDSPAWRDAFEDLQRSMRNGRRGEGTLDMGKLTKLLTPEKLNLPDGKKLFDRLGNLKPANMPRWNWRPPSVSAPTVPPLSAPSLPAGAALGTVAVWLLCLGLLAVLLWQASRWFNVEKRGGPAAAEGLGPWPVNPGKVTTRQELVRAFDYLALLVLGPRARSWNHHTVARSLAERAAPLADTADQLASIYEWARYTEGAEPLPTYKRDRARRALTQLAGMTSA